MPLLHSCNQQAASYPEFLSLSQLSRASLLKAAAAATLLLVSWMLAIVSADETTSISPARSPVARQPYGTILHDMYMKRRNELNDFIVHISILGWATLRYISWYFKISPRDKLSPYCFNQISISIMQQYFRDDCWYFQKNIKHDIFDK